MKQNKTNQKLLEGLFPGKRNEAMATLDKQPPKNGRERGSLSHLEGEILLAV
jgi:hypothetical protein